MTSRSIPPEAWAKAFQALVFYFSRRLGVENAQDLAQQTLLVVLQRHDFTFEKEEDFLRVCYGFAGNILRASLRKDGKRGEVSLDSIAMEREDPSAGAKRLENAIYLQDVLRVGEEQLNEREWEIIGKAAEAQLESQPYSYGADKPNAVRVALHRARKKLEELTSGREK
jgi:DNA-directed RNA polymerase specialized sigma24 family protein